MKEQNPQIHVCQTQVGGQELCISTGELAKQAGGAVMVQYGDTIVLGTANLSKPLYDDGDFLPLLVDYEEKYYAAGKIKGSRFIKREGRPSDEATLTARLTDRCIRPLFPENMINDVQVVLTVLSYDGVNDPDILGIVAASAALSISDVPWDGPIAAVRVGRIADKFVINPTTEEREQSELDLIVAGTGERIVMIEGGANGVPEEILLDAFEEAQKALGLITPDIQEMQSKVGKDKKEPTLMKHDAEIQQKLQDLARDALTSELQQAQVKTDFKAAEAAGVAAIQAGLSDEEQEEISEGQIKNAVHELRGDYAREQAFAADWREGGRALDEVRPLLIKTGLLPRTHGSSLFQRGETQILNVLTLGGPSDVQHIDTMEVEEKKRYIHYYNFPAFSVGENKPNRGPGRREIGHGALAERALLPVLPKEEDWPYTMLLISEVLESNGSSSMASVCGSSLSLMAGGVPIKDPVAGIAMGLFTNDSGDYKILTDIAGVEDEKGDMDFKIAGTKDGITALQMDIKVDGINRQILSDALAQARQARLHILDAMNAVISEPSPEMSQYAPRIETIRIPVEKIGDLIGPKGKHINEIIEETGVEIDINDDGIVSITSNEKEAMAKAKEWVHNLTREIEVDEKFEGRVTRIMDFGAFVELIPNVEGMVHISEFRDERIENINDVVKVGDVISVVVIEIDQMGRINLSHKAALPSGNADAGAALSSTLRDESSGSDSNESSSKGANDQRSSNRGGDRPSNGGNGRGQRSGPFSGPRPPR